MQKMNADLDSSESSSGRFLHTLRPLRDLESNWTVDLAKNLEQYLLKICSGQISADEVNFAEAALLLQGSVQVYSRKVEYLHSLVLHALDFISKKSQEDQEAGPSARADSTGKHSAKEEGDDLFWGLDDIPVDAKNLLDNTTCRDVPPSHFVRPPANLVVLEGECLDTGGDAGELQSYLLATCDLYRDFILLDSCDAVAIDSFLDSRGGKGPTIFFKVSSVISKGRKSFLAPSRQSGGTAQKLSAKKKNDTNLFQSPCADQRFESNDCNFGHSPPPASDFHADWDNGFGTGDAYSDHGDANDSDDDDPWKPLNPHAPGNLKVKPYKKVKAKTRLNVGSRKLQLLTAEFPLAKLGSLISLELNDIWEAKLCASEKRGRAESLPLYEKLRQTLVLGEKKTNYASCNPENNTEDNGYEDNRYEDNGYESGDPDMGPSYFDMPDKIFNHEDVPPHQEKENPDAHANLEDLCRSHLDALLDTLAENEKQTEMATRVSTWKQRIEQNLEEQEARPPFDIHKYGDRVLDKLSMEKDGGNALSFSNVVKGQKKHDVARTFSALLQLVNNEDVDLVRSSPASTSTCYSEKNPFHVRLLKNEKKKGVLLQSAKKRAKSPLVKAHAKVKSCKGKENCAAPNSSPQGCSSIYRSRCTPEGKKRRKSSIVPPLDMNFVG